MTRGGDDRQGDNEMATNCHCKKLLAGWKWGVAKRGMMAMAREQVNDNGKGDNEGDNNSEGDDEGDDNGEGDNEGDDNSRTRWRGEQRQQGEWQQGGE